MIHDHHVCVQLRGGGEGGPELAGDTCKRDVLSPHGGGAEEEVNVDDNNNQTRFAAIMPPQLLLDGGPPKGLPSKTAAGGQEVGTAPP